MALEVPDMKPVMGFIDHALSMSIIEVRPCKKFKGAWVAFEFPGVEPAFATPDAKRKAIDYACQRFGGGAGEVHVYGDDGTTIERNILIDGRGQCPQGVCE